jgi:hypothetical protein
LQGEQTSQAGVKENLVIIHYLRKITFGDEKMSRWDETDPRHGCIGVNTVMGNPLQLCARGLMCPRCEERRATKRAWKLCNRLQNDLDVAEDAGLDLEVGVLTVTLPGRHHPIRMGSLRQQYDYMTERKTVAGYVGEHSMRGLNKKLAEWGFTGGCHNLEFTWNEQQQWWNVHDHAIVVGYKEDVECSLKDTKQLTWNDDDLLPQETVGNGASTELYRLGFGGIYSLDWAKSDEFEQAIRYASKVAYMTKPIKAPGEKRSELRKFFNGTDGGNFPRLSRPIGDWGRSFVPSNPI